MHLYVYIHTDFERIIKYIDQARAFENYCTVFICNLNLKVYLNEEQLLSTFISTYLKVCDGT